MKMLGFTTHTAVGSLNTFILVFCILTEFPSTLVGAATFNLTLHHQHPNPEAVVQQLQRALNVSLSRRQMLSTAAGTAESKDQLSCLTGNPIDDCWRCDPNWYNDRQRLADCGIGFGQAALGGKGGQIYVVSDSSDVDTANPKPGTLRYAVIETEPLWIIFSANMLIELKHELLVNSYKTIDGRGANIHITGGGCITLHDVTNVIVHNIEISHCVPSGSAIVRSSPIQAWKRGKSDGDGISIHSSRNIWIDHCALSYCSDGIYGHNDIKQLFLASQQGDAFGTLRFLLAGFLPDSGMQVTIAFNHFEVELVQRMPRCRHGYIHVVNNDYTAWEMYAIGGSASPTINSQGNRYTASENCDNKEVTKREDTDPDQWAGWNWRTDGDIMVNGAFFVPSGDVLSPEFAKAMSTVPRSAQLIDQLTMNSGVFGHPRYQDELIAAWLHKASKGAKYWNYVTNNVPKISETFTAFGWDAKHAGINILVSKFVMNTYLNSDLFLPNADRFVCNILPESPSRSVSYSPGGLLFKPSNLQHVTALSFALLIYGRSLKYSNKVIHCDNVVIAPSRIIRFAKIQVDYILGSNPAKMSYMVGYGPKYPQKIHRQGSTLSSVNAHPNRIKCEEGSPYFSSDKPNPNLLTWAIVGGPNINDSYEDSRVNFVQSEPTTYINATSVGVLAYFRKRKSR